MYVAPQQAENDLCTGCRVGRLPSITHAPLSKPAFESLSDNNTHGALPIARSGRRGELRLGPEAFSVAVDMLDALVDAAVRQDDCAAVVAVLQLALAVYTTTGG